MTAKSRSFGLRVKLPTCLPHTSDASHFPIAERQTGKALNTNFYSRWFDRTGNQTQVYHFSSRVSIHSNTEGESCRLPANQLHMIVRITIKLHCSGYVRARPWRDPASVSRKLKWLTCHKISHTSRNVTVSIALIVLLMKVN